MKSIAFLNDSGNKRLESVKVYYINLLDNDNVVEPSQSNTYTAEIGLDGRLVKQVQLTIEDSHLVLPTKKIADLPSGKYNVEIWEDNGTDKSIYPDEGTQTLRINSNLQDLPQGTVSQITLDEFMNQFKQAMKNAGASSDGEPINLNEYAKKSELPNILVDQENRTITINGQTINVPKEIDLSNYVTKDSANSYATHDDLEKLSEDFNKTFEPFVIQTQNDIAKKIDKSYINLYPETRALQIGDKDIKIPENINLSDYAKTSDVPSVVYNAEQKTLTINGQQVSLSNDVDLSNYYTKQDVDGFMNNVSPLVTNTLNDKLTNYVTETKLQDTLSKLNTGGDVVTEEVGLTNIINGDGQSVTENFSGGIVTYSKSTGCGIAWLIAPTGLSISFAFSEGWNGDEHDIAKQQFNVLPDDDVKKLKATLANYATKDSVPSVTYDADKKTLTVNGQQVSLPSSVDLSKYATTDDLNDFAQSVEDDVDRSLEDVKSTANLAFNTANAKLDPSALNDYATNASVDEKIKSVKLSSDIKKRPTAVRADLSDIQDPYFAFDNGAEIHFENTGVINLTGASGYGSGNQVTQFKTDQQIDNVMSYLAGYLLLTSIQKAPASNFAIYTRSNVVNPFNDISQWNWETMSLSKDRPVASANELKFVQAWYAVGLFSDAQIESLGVVKKGETN